VYQQACSLAAVHLGASCSLYQATCQAQLHSDWVQVLLAVIVALRLLLLLLLFQLKWLLGLCTTMCCTV
jgi:hypothetical protein